MKASKPVKKSNLIKQLMTEIELMSRQGKTKRNLKSSSIIFRIYLFLVLVSRDLLKSTFHRCCIFGKLTLIFAQPRLHH